jgi:hypothetical protein
MHSRFGSVSICITYCIDIVTSNLLFVKFTENKFLEILQDLEN